MPCSININSQINSYQQGRAETFREAGGQKSFCQQGVWGGCVCGGGDWHFVCWAWGSDNNFVSGVVYSKGAGAWAPPKAPNVPA